MIAQHPVRQRLKPFPLRATAPVTDRDPPRNPRLSPLDDRAGTVEEVTMCKVLNKHRDGVPAGAVYVGRGGKWGNPFHIGPDGDRAAVIARHEAWLRDQHDLLRALDELRGRDLVCYCAPQPCHGNLLLRLANASRDERVAWWRRRG
jgi:hypothetical protein